MKVIGREQIQLIEDLTGLNAGGIAAKLEREISIIEGYDKDIYKSFDSYFKGEFERLQVWDFLEEEEKETIDFKFLALVPHTQPGTFQKLSNAISQLTMLGDGRCDHCGSDELEEIDREGHMAGDYLNQPQFSGKILFECKCCHHIQEDLV